MLSKRTGICRLGATALALSLVACGGGGSDAPANDAGGAAQDWIQGQFLPAETFAAHCAAPRTALDQNTGLPAFDDIPGTVLDENNWLRSWTNDLYLWYDEVPDRDPAGYSEPLDYFAVLRTPALTSTGSPKDRFHFALDTAQWLAESQSGISAGFGMELALLSPYPPREAAVAYTQPGSPATAAGLTRGARILSVDGADLVNGNTQAIIDVLNAGLFPDSAGEPHTFEVLDLGASVPRSITMTSATITTQPVQGIDIIASPQGAAVGYLHFTDHIATAEPALRDAVAQLASAGIEDLIIDLRYNGGGFLAIASQLAYMVAGAPQTSGRVFEAVQFNDKHPTTNPVTGFRIDPLPFLTTTIGLAETTPPNQPLPTLDLGRVFVISGPATCSASESIINSLRGVGVEVVQIGSRTCGKPYGFYPADNCGTTYFSIQFRGVNDAGFGDYADGFAPAGASAPSDTVLPGCVVEDDFNHLLGDVREARLAAALQYRDSATCPLVAASSTIDESVLRAQSDQSPSALALELEPKSPLRTNRILTPP